MTQLHLYVPDDVAAKVQERAERQGLSVSRYLARLVKKEIGEGWPEGYFEDVIGGWKGEPLTRPPQGTPERRIKLR